MQRLWRRPVSYHEQHFFYSCDANRQQFPPPFSDGAIGTVDVLSLQRAMLSQTMSV